MKDTILTICFIFLIFEMTHGQSHNFESINDTEQEIINDLSLTFKDKSYSYLLSPFIVAPISMSNLNTHELKQKYGFNKRQLKSPNKDTLIINKNNCFEIINPDSLTKYQTIPRDTAVLIRDPVLYSIEKYYGKSGICYFRKIVISKSKNYAIVEYWMYCGFLCGYGETVIMRRINNKWIIFETLAKTIS